ncbi:hypothetical protein [Taibaiella koreensis]|uniref:hypothetical protein n=1 Tax=Taibaiella koreensis TaxID=1268548 RepID=UPI000E5A066F|nr:hypothetical protein [Taibaiella koreensis]
MSLKSFQEALAEIISSPLIGQAYYKDPASLEQKYSLTEKERNRLLGMIQQKSMKANYMLYQMNRLTPLTMLMNYTLKIIHPQLMPLLHEFWKAYPRTSFQFKDEIGFFSDFLKKKIAAGQLDMPFLEDVLNIDDALNDIRFDKDETSYVNDDFFTLHPLARVVHLTYDATALVEAMVTYDAAQPAPDVPVAPGYYVLYYSGRLRCYPVDAATAEALLERRAVEDIPEELVDDEILI